MGEGTIRIYCKAGKSLFFGFGLWLFKFSQQLPASLYIIVLAFKSSKVMCDCGVCDR